MSTFRTRHLPLKQESFSAHTELNNAKQRGSTSPSRSNSVRTQGDSRKSFKRSSIMSNGASKRRISSISNAANKLDERKAQRNERMSVFKDLMKNKPDNKYEDPRDVSAIKYAQNNMGDYKLKTNEDYIVPENERIDTDKKKRQITLLTEGAHMLKQVENI